MKKRLRIILTVLTLLAMVCVLAICFVWMSQFRVQDLRRDLSNVMNTASYLTNVGDTSDYDAYAKRLARDLHGDIRVTIVAVDGKVLGDSYADYSAMANHLDRPEMIEAIRDGYGEDVRKSETTGEDNFYAAMILTDGIYIRVSAPVAVAYSFILQVLPPVLLLCVAVFLVILFLSRRVSARFTRPFEELSGAVEGLIIDGKPGEISAPPYDELVPVVRNIRDLSGRLQMYIAEIKQKSAEIEDIISATDDGVVVLDGSMHIITINERAKELFGGAGDAKSFEMVCRETFSWAAKSSWVMPRARRSSCNRSPNAIRLSSLSVILAEPPRRFHQLCFASGKIPCNFRFPSGKCGSGGVYRYCIMPILQIPFHFGYKTSRPAGGSCGKSRRASRHFPQSAL